MTYFAGLDVSLEESAICIVDETGQVVREAKVASEPAAMAGYLLGTAAFRDIADHRFIVRHGPPSADNAEEALRRAPRQGRREFHSTTGQILNPDSGKPYTKFFFISGVFA